MHQLDFALVLTILQTIVVIVGIPIALVQLWQSGRIAAGQNALRIIERWTEIRERSRDLARRADEQDEDSDFESLDRYRRLSMIEALDFFELIALAEKKRVADRSLLKSYFPSILEIWIGEEEVKLIDEKQRSNPTIYEHLVELCSRWAVPLPRSSPTKNEVSAEDQLK